MCFFKSEGCNLVLIYLYRLIQPVAGALYCRASFDLKGQMMNALGQEVIEQSQRLSF